MCRVLETVRTRSSSRRRTWNCGTRETQTDVHNVGIFTMPEMEFPYATMDEVVAAIRRIAAELVNRDKFLLALGGEHSITPAVVAAVAGKYPGVSVLQIDAHADLRERRSWARRTTTRARCGAPWSSRERRRWESAACPARRRWRRRHLRTEIFYDYNMREDPHWVDRVVDSLSDTVYISVDVDGLDPASCPRPVRRSLAGCRGTRR